MGRGGWSAEVWACYFFYGGGRRRARGVAHVVHHLRGGAAAVEVEDGGGRAAAIHHPLAARAGGRYLALAGGARLVALLRRAGPLRLPHSALSGVGRELGTPDDPFPPPPLTDIPYRWSGRHRGLRHEDKNENRSQAAATQADKRRRRRGEFTHVPSPLSVPRACTPMSALRASYPPQAPGPCAVAPRAVLVGGRQNRIWPNRFAVPLLLFFCCRPGFQ